MRRLVCAFMLAAILAGVMRPVQAQGYRPQRDISQNRADHRPLRDEDIVLGAIILVYLNFPALLYFPFPYQMFLGFRYWDSSPSHGEIVLAKPVEPLTPLEALPRTTAPGHATEAIVTEAETPAVGRPDPSVRPLPRPVPNAHLPDTATPVQPGSDSIALTSAEKTNLTVAVLGCWNVGSLSSAALTVTITVGFTMTPDGRPVSASVRMLDRSGGSDAAARQAFEAARRAIIHCGLTGYQLPIGKYEQWREIEMTFNPEFMRIK